MYTVIIHYNSHASVVRSSGGGGGGLSEEVSSEEEDSAEEDSTLQKGYIHVYKFSCNECHDGFVVSVGLHDFSRPLDALSIQLLCKKT